MNCSVEGCGPAKRLICGWCGKHYQRFRNHGDPLITLVAPPDMLPVDRLEWTGWEFNSRGCWIWRGAKDGWGYGTVTIGGKQRGAHLLAYETWIGPIPDGKILRHRCDTPACINPEHLIPGTFAQNSADRDERGRSGSAKVTVEQVKEIRALRSTTQLTLADIGKIFGLSRDGVAAIVYRKVWKNV